MKSRTTLQFVAVLSMLLAGSFIVNSSASVLTNGLVAYYPFSGNANDASGNGHDGVELGGLEYVDGVMGSALSLNGVNGKIQVPHSDELNLVGGFTLSCWIQSSGTNPNCGILAKIQSGGSRNGYLLSSNNNAGTEDVKVFVMKNFPTGHGKAYTGNGVLDGEWHHIVATYDGANIVIYDNAQVGMNSEHTGGMTPNTLPLYIGWDPYGNTRYFDGEIDEVAIYNRALSFQEVTALYEAVPEPASVGLMVLFAGGLWFVRRFFAV